MLSKKVIAEKNLYLAEKLLSILKRKKTKQFFRQERLFAQNDSIAHYNAFLKLLDSEDIVTYNGGQLENEGDLYGIAGQLYEYGHCKKTSNIYIPRVEHGIRFKKDISDLTSAWLNYCAIAQGPYRKSLIHKYDPEIPIYCVGPYIQYAKPYYTKYQFEEKKKEWGKTLLFMPSHSCENEACYFNEKIVDFVMNKYGKEYDTVVVCVYWHDVNESILKMFEERGAVLVSAGVRWDTHFLSRLRTIIELADSVLVENIGTNVGYCRALGKSIKFLPRELTSPHFEKQLDELSVFIDAFNNNHVEKIEELYNYYWGGNISRTPEEIQAIIENCVSVLKLANYNIKNYKKSQKRYLYKVSVDNDELSCMKKRLLEEALQDG